MKTHHQDGRSLFGVIWDWYVSLGFFGGILFLVTLALIGSFCVWWGTR